MFLLVNLSVWSHEVFPHRTPQPKTGSEESDCADEAATGNKINILGYLSGTMLIDQQKNY